MICALCKKRIRTDRPYISGSESIGVDFHVSCLYSAKPIDILRVLELDIVFCYLSGSNAITLADMNPERGD